MSTKRDHYVRQHRAIIVTNRLQHAGIQTLDWLSRILEHSSIEHGLDELQWRLDNRLNALTTRVEFKRALVRE